MRFCWILLTIFTLCAVSICFLIPPTEGPDETFHWRSSIYQSDAVLGNNNNNCSFEEAVPDYFQTGRIQGHRDQHSSIGLFKEAEASLHTSCSTWASTKKKALVYPNVLLVRLFMWSPSSHGAEAVNLFYLSRLSGLLFVLLALFRLLAVGRESIIPGFILIMTVLLTPIGVSQAAMVSTDPIVFCFVLFALILTIYPERALWLDYGMFLVTGLSALYIKPILYVVLLPGLVLLTLKWILHVRFAAGLKFFGIGTKRTILIAIFSLVVAVLGYLTFHDPSIPKKEGINPKLVLSFLTSYPFPGWLAIKDCVLTFLNVDSFMGPMGSLDLDVKNSAIRSYKTIAQVNLFAAAYYTLRYFKGVDFKKLLSIEVLLSAGSFVICGVVLGFLSILGMYLYWTVPELALKQVDGVQSRYFIPVYILFIGSGIVFFAAHAPKNDLIKPMTNTKINLIVSNVTEVLVILFGCVYLVGLSLSCFQRYW